MIPLIIGTCPILLFHVTHFLSFQEGCLPWCIPYWDSCTSISATGRSGQSRLTGYWNNWRLVPADLYPDSGRGYAEL